MTLDAGAKDLAAGEFDAEVVGLTEVKYHFAGDEDGAIDSLRGFSDMPTAFSHGYEFVLVKGAGHFLHREKPDEFLAKLIQFLEE